MFKQRKLSIVLVTVAALIVALVPSGLRPALAQEGDEVPPVAIEITGTVMGIQIGQIMVDDYPVPVPDNFDLTTLVLGDVVLVTGELMQGDVLVVTSILIVTGDVDQDGAPDEQDNCPATFNPDLLDTDLDGLGDACDPDLLDGDEDTIVDSQDNCPMVANFDQLDTDTDGMGDACDPDQLDSDIDGFVDSLDNCPDLYNIDQADTDLDGIGDACDEETTEETAQEPVSACADRDHPVAASLAEAFGVDESVIMGWHCDGNGFGNIARALMVSADVEGYSVDDLLVATSIGNHWNQIIREAGLSPSEFSLGRVISGRYGHNNGNTEQEMEQETLQAGSDRPGNSGNAPGQQNHTNNGNSRGNNGNNGNNGHGNANGHGK
jgi:hypothetical protein